MPEDGSVALPSVIADEYTSAVAVANCNVKEAARMMFQFLEIKIRLHGSIMQREIREYENFCKEQSQMRDT